MGLIFWAFNFALSIFHTEDCEASLRGDYRETLEWESGGTRGQSERSLDRFSLLVSVSLLKTPDPQ